MNWHGISLERAGGEEGGAGRRCDGNSLRPADWLARGLLPCLPTPCISSRLQGYD